MAVLYIVNCKFPCIVFLKYFADGNLERLLHLFFWFTCILSMECMLLKEKTEGEKLLDSKLTVKVMSLGNFKNHMYLYVPSSDEIQKYQIKSF